METIYKEKLLGSQKQKDIFGRQIDYLRVSVTGKCNMRCIYCMPASPGTRQVHGEKKSLLSFEEIYKTVLAAASLGISKVRLTGGEPLLRREIDKLISMIAAVPHIDYISMTTNGFYLARYTERLKSSGLQGINLSLDSLAFDKYQRITKNGSLSDILLGLEKALIAGLKVKINVVLIKGINDDEIVEFLHFADKWKICVRFIEFMPVRNNALSWHRDKIVPLIMVKNVITKYFGELKAVASSQNLGHGPAEYFRTFGEKITVGFISPSCGKYCRLCNRLRLTSEGTIKNCLFGKSEISVKESLEKDNWFEETRHILSRSIDNKPRGYFLNEACQVSESSPRMFVVGG